MYEYTGKMVVAYYVNKEIYNTYLTDKERYMFNLLDYFRYEMLYHLEEYPHINTRTQQANAGELWAVFWTSIMTMREQVYSKYADEYKDNPEKAAEDMRKALKDITPAKFVKDVFHDLLSTRELDEIDIDRIRLDLEAVCDPMLRVINNSSDVKLKEKAKARIMKKSDDILRYVRGKTHEED